MVKGTLFCLLSAGGELLTSGIPYTSECSVVPSLLIFIYLDYFLIHCNEAFGIYLVLMPLL